MTFSSSSLEDLFVRGVVDLGFLLKELVSSYLSFCSFVTFIHQELDFFPRNTALSASYPLSDPSRPENPLKMAPKTKSPYMSLHLSTSTIDLSSHRHHRSVSEDLEDADNESETTLANESNEANGFLSKRSNRKSKSSRLSTILTWIRWGTIVFLQGIIIILLLPTSGLMDSGWGMGLVGKGGEKGDGIVQPGVVVKDSSVGGKWTAGKTETGGDVNGLYVPSESPIPSPKKLKAGRMICREFHANN